MKILKTNNIDFKFGFMIHRVCFEAHLDVADEDKRPLVFT